VALAEFLKVEDGLIVELIEYRDSITILEMQARWKAVKTPLRFHTLDVFTNTKFNGKALAVVESCDNLSDFEMSSLAREFNLPATAFLCAPRDPVNSVSLRTFVTNGAELAFQRIPHRRGALIAQTAPWKSFAAEVVVAIETGTVFFLAKS